MSYYLPNYDEIMKAILPTKEEWSKWDPQCVHPKWFLVTATEYDGEPLVQDCDVDLLYCNLPLIHEDYEEYTSDKYAFKSTFSDATKVVLKKINKDIPIDSSDFGNLVFALYTIEAAVKESYPVHNYFADESDPRTQRPLKETSNDNKFEREKSAFIRFLTLLESKEKKIQEIKLTFGPRIDDVLSLENNLVLQHIEQIFINYKKEKSPLRVMQHSDYHQFKSVTKFVAINRRYVNFNKEKLNYSHSLIVSAGYSRYAAATIIMLFLFEMDWLDENEAKNKFENSTNAYTYNKFIARDFLNMIK